MHKFLLFLVAGAALLGTSCIRYESKVSVVISRTISGFHTPESAIHDTVDDVYLVSNIHGSPFGDDGQSGFISRVKPDGTIENKKWIDGSGEGVTLNAPKGLAIAGDTLYVADVTVVRKFDRASGAPRGEIPIEGATFLNDLWASPSGDVYVSDTGMKAGFEPSGTDAIYRIGSGDTVTTVHKGTDLNQPNGLWGDGEKVLFASWAEGAVRSVDADGRIEQVASLPKAQLDGIVRITDGSLLVTSWEGSCIYQIAANGTVSTVEANIDAPADLGYDATRDRMLVPLFNDNQLELKSRR